MEGIKMGLEKTTAIQDWEAPGILNHVRAFLGFANFYGCFVPNYSKIVQPLTLLTWKGGASAWKEE
jgi:hypothetical protein